MAIKRPDTPLAATPDPTITYTSPKGKSYLVNEGDGDNKGSLTIKKVNGATRTITNTNKANRKMQRVINRNTVDGKLKGNIE